MFLKTTIQKTIKVGGVTLNQTPLRWTENKQNIIHSIKEAKEKKVELLCFPELCITGYGCEDYFLHRWVVQRALDILLEIKEECSDIAVLIGLPLFFENKIYNTTAFISDTQIMGFYVKQTLPNYGVHYEQRWFSQWKPEFRTEIQMKNETYPIGEIIFELNNISIAVEICEDAWSQIRPACRYVQQGVDIILNASASHFAFQKYKEREKLVQESSKTFNTLYIYCNLLGNEAGKIIYDGDIIIAHRGNILERNERFLFTEYTIITADVELNKIDYNTSLSQEYISENEEFVAACSLGLYDFMRKTKSKGFTLSLSGGADSVTCALLVREMVKRSVQQIGIYSFCKNIGIPLLLKESDIMKQILITVYQSTENNSDTTFLSAHNVAKEIHCTFLSWEIDSLIEQSLHTVQSALHYNFTWEKDDTTLQNIQARIRSPLVWLLANIHNYVLLTTSNRSEGDVGYATMDGDTSGGLAPLAGVSKHFIKQWLLWAEKNLGYSQLLYVNALKPTAELRPIETKQTDENDLMPYNILLQIEILAIKEKLSPQEVLQTLLSQDTGIEEKALKGYVKKFYSLWSKSQWKRERIAPAFHLDTFSIDPKGWGRFPIISASLEDELL
ncbi:MAG: NAD(+) synthase [Chitinophagaceae bacterium]|nr:NAD(+) synthase [Chitinophagaceae bacterium]